MTVGSPSRVSCATAETSLQQHDGGGGEAGFGLRDRGLEVLRAAPVAADPREEALHDPPPRVDGEADLPVWFADDLDAGGTGARVVLARVARIGEGECDEGPSAPRGAQQRRSAVTVLNVVRMDVEHQRAAVSIHHGVKFVAFNPLARAVNAWRAALRGLGALAVDHRRRRAGLASGALMVEDHVVVVQRLPHAAIAQQAARAARPQNVVDGLDDLLLWPCPPSSPAQGRVRQLGQHRPFPGR